MAPIGVWYKAEIVVDANILLNLFRFSSEKSKELEDTLKELNDRIWLPRQFYDEYRRRLPTVKKDISSEYRKGRGDLQSYRDKTKNILTQFHNRGGLVVATYIPRIDEIFQELLTDIICHSKEHVSRLFEDDLENRIEKLVSGKVGNPLSHSRLADIPMIWQWRLDRKIPPGLKDKRKPEPRRYGDLIGWLQIIDRADHTGRPVILITDDVKANDWFCTKDGAPSGPHPKLVKELYDKTGVDLYIYTSEQFVWFARIFLKLRAAAAAMGEYLRVHSPSFLPDFGTLSALRNLTAQAPLLNTLGDTWSHSLTAITRINPFADSRLDALNSLSSVGAMLDSQLDLVGSWSSIDAVLGNQLDMINSLSNVSVMLDSQLDLVGSWSSIDAVLGNQLDTLNSLSSISAMWDSQLDLIGSWSSVDAVLGNQLDALNSLSSISAMLDSQLDLVGSWSSVDAVLGNQLDTLNSLSSISAMLDSQLDLVGSWSSIDAVLGNQLDALDPLSEILALGSTGLHGENTLSSISAVHGILTDSIAGISSSNSGILPLNDTIPVLSSVYTSTMKSIFDERQRKFDAIQKEEIRRTDAMIKQIQKRQQPTIDAILKEQQRRTKEIMKPIMEQQKPRTDAFIKGLSLPKW